MEAPQIREHLKSLISLICEEQEKIRTVIGPPKSFQQSLAVSLEPLKTPIYVLWGTLGYGNFPQSRVQLQWLASFKTSPSDFLSECIIEIKTCEIPVENLKVHRQLIDFYSELQEIYD